MAIFLPLGEVTKVVNPCGGYIPGRPMYGKLERDFKDNRVFKEGSFTPLECKPKKGGKVERKATKEKVEREQTKKLMSRVGMNLHRNLKAPMKNNVGKRIYYVGEEKHVTPPIKQVPGMSRGWVVRRLGNNCGFVCKATDIEKKAAEDDETFEPKKNKNSPKDTGLK